MPVTLIVGAKFRPPALGLLSVLGLGTKLIVRREPSNPHDVNALQVLVSPEELCARVSVRTLQAAVEGFGFSAAEVLAAATLWHLGYVPKDEAAEWSACLDAAGKSEVPGTLIFNMLGKPCVTFEVF